MERMSRKAWDAVVMIVGCAAAFGLFAALYSAFWLTVRELPHGETVRRRDVVIEAEEAGPEAVKELPETWQEGGGIAAADNGVPADYMLDVPLSAEFQAYLHGLCEEAGVPYTLAVAVVEQESHYDPAAISPTNDWGLMQISAICHEWLEAELGIDDWLDPYQNAKAGVFILGGYYRLYGAVSGTLVAYNRGQAYADALFAEGIYETAYSRSVMGIQYRLEQNGR